MPQNTGLDSIHLHPCSAESGLAFQARPPWTFSTAFKQFHSLAAHFVHLFWLLSCVRCSTVTEWKSLASVNITCFTINGFFIVLSIVFMPWYIIDTHKLVGI